MTDTPDDTSYCIVIPFKTMEELRAHEKTLDDTPRLIEIRARVYYDAAQPKEARP